MEHHWNPIVLTVNIIITVVWLGTGPLTDYMWWREFGERYYKGYIVVPIAAIFVFQAWVLGYRL